MFGGPLRLKPAGVLPARLLYSFEGIARTENKSSFDKISEGIFSYLLRRAAPDKELAQAGTDLKAIYEGLLDKRYLKAEQAVLDLGLQMELALVQEFYKTTVVARRAP